MFPRCVITCCVRACIVPIVAWLVVATKGRADEPNGRLPVRVVKSTTAAPLEYSLRESRLKNPLNPEVHARLARFLMGKPGHQNEVIGLAEQAAALDPETPSRWTLVAQAYEMARKPDGAIAAATKALALKADAPEPHYIRGLAREQKRDLDGALDDFLAAAKLDPTQVLFPLGVGRIRMEKKDWTGAIAPLRRAISLGSKGTFAQGMLGRAMAESGDVDGAVALLDRLVAERPGDATAWAARGGFYVGRREFEKGADDFAHAAKLDNTSNAYLFEQGWALWRLGRPLDAIECFDRYLSRNRMNRFAWLTRGHAKEDIGKFKEAAADIGRAVEMDRSNPEFRRSYGIVLFAAGEFHAALEQFNRSVELKLAGNEYSLFWTYIIRWRLDNKRDPALISEIARTTKSAWTRTVAQFLTGEIDEAEFLARAGKGDDEDSRGERCESYFYSAIVRELQGETGARGLLEKCISLNKTDFAENALAIGELQRMPAQEPAPAAAKPGQNG